MSNQLIYNRSDGCPLYARVIGQGPALIMLHGGGPDHHSMRPLADHLTDHFTVALPDIRGYGRSVCTDQMGHTWAQYAKDVISLMDALDRPPLALSVPVWAEQSHCE